MVGFPVIVLNLVIQGHDGTEFSWGLFLVNSRVYIYT